MFLRSISPILIAVILGTSLAGCGNTSAQPLTAQPLNEAPASEQPTPPTDTPASAPAPTTEEPSAPTEAAADASGSATTEPESEVAFAKLNLNRTPGDDFLSTIPGMGDRMVREFLEYRPYVSIQQFRQEIGKYVGQEQVAEYEKYVYVPVAINDADAATLQQIPGVDQAEAEELMAGRPYASVDDFLAGLAEYISEADLSTARNYLSDQ